MSEDVSKLSCDEFQSQIPGLLSSGADIENHAHVKTCAICHQFLREIENIAEKARHFRFGGDEFHPDDWSETT